MLILCLYHGSAESPGPTSYMFAVVKKKKKAQKQKKKKPKQQQQQKTQTQIWAKPSLLHYCLGKPKLQDCGCTGNHPSCGLECGFLFVFLNSPLLWVIQVLHACLMDWMCAFPSKCKCWKLNLSVAEFGDGTSKEVIGFSEVIEWGLEPLELVSL